ncbi:uncharacterized protein PHACADRAFT_260003 [Phanerochaete carnosa HHB-10118-sp]|uniref:Uncharacterized protein n=1 Tax=Phanerochaete carnosa (strain HHB-10118-sp) TaxID=650164 RepID=K5UUA2_PHACS|nr:uncharacterized protein PHACADRAFT_260003 [Phanerochaete carnosa HHB-10118-sp]EKM53576.1 hypothetical protein PHACADRAFT_260003 [Phanerochaete carnosa HHB-10118-sp]
MYPTRSASLDESVVFVPPSTNSQAVFTLEEDECFPMTLDTMSRDDSKLCIPQVNSWENALQLTHMEPEFPAQVQDSFLVGRLGTPPPPSQPPGLTFSLDSVSSSGSFDERYSAFAAGALPEERGVAKITSDMARLRVEPTATVPGRVPNCDADADIGMDIDIEFTSVEHYDAKTIVDDIMRFNPTDEDRTLLRAPYLTFCRDLPSVDDVAAAD